MQDLKRLGIGLDFGTSNSAVAWFDGSSCTACSWRAAAPSCPRPSTWIATTWRWSGSAAIDRYVEENRGRRVELVAEVIGETASSVSGNNTGEDISRLETRRHAIYGPLYDRTLAGPAVPGTEAPAGRSRTWRRLTVFERHYRLVALLTPILQHIRERLEARAGRAAAGDPCGSSGDLRGPASGSQCKSPAAASPRPAITPGLGLRSSIPSRWPPR